MMLLETPQSIGTEHHPSRVCDKTCSEEVCRDLWLGGHGLTLKQINFFGRSDSRLSPNHPQIATDTGFWEDPEPCRAA